MMGRGRQRDVQRDDVGAAQQLIERDVAEAEQALEMAFGLARLMNRTRK